jgi:hypothetical protein
MARMAAPDEPLEAASRALLPTGADKSPRTTKADAAAVTTAFHAFCLALQCATGAAAAAELRAVIAQGPDWASVIEGARRHRAAALLLGGFQQCAAVVPDAVLAKLRQQAAAGARRSLLQAAETVRLLDLLTEAGIRAFSLKGVPLSVQLYGSVGVREARDIDFLIDPARFEAAAEVLAKAGYRRDRPALSPRQRDAYRRRFKDVDFVDARGGAVELHDRLTDDPELLPCDFEALWRRRATVRVAEAEIPVLPRPQLDLYLCVHGAEHMWERLRWLTDIAMLLRRPGAVDDAVAAAEQEGLAAPVLHALLLAHDWIGLPLDAGMIVRARTDRRVRRLDRCLMPSYAGAAWSGQTSPGSFAALMRHSLWQRLYRLSLRSNWRYRLRHLYGELIAPDDWGLWRLPDRLFWLYPALRPFGWLLRRIAGRSSISD